MGLQDRDYMRERFRQKTSGGGPPRDGMKTLTIAGAAIGVASAAFWFLRDVSHVLPSRTADKGSLIVNINTASQEQLETVPGIGPTRAAQIIAGRPYENIDDLERLHGIGRAQVQDMRKFLTTHGLTAQELTKTGQ